MLRAALPLGTREKRSTRAALDAAEEAAAALVVPIGDFVAPGARPKPPVDAHASCLLTAPGAAGRCTVVVVNGLLSNGRLPHAYYYKQHVHVVEVRTCMLLSEISTTRRHRYYNACADDARACSSMRARAVSKGRTGHGVVGVGVGVGPAPALGSPATQVPSHRGFVRATGASVRATWQPQSQPHLRWWTCSLCHLRSWPMLMAFALT